MHESAGESELRRVLDDQELGGLTVAAEQYQAQDGKSATHKSVSEFADVIWLTAAQKMQLLGSRALSASNPPPSLPDESDEVSAPVIPIRPGHVSDVREKRTARGQESGVDPDHFNSFMNKASEYALLTRQQEVMLGRSVQSGLKAQERLDAGGYASEQARSDDEQLLLQGNQAQETFVLASLRLVGKYAREYYLHHPLGRRFDLMDLYQEGVFGLKRAAEEFDPERGFKFSTYATKLIKGRMDRALNDRGSTIRLPTRVHNSLRDIKTSEDQGLSDDEIMRSLGISNEELQDLRYRRSLGGELVSLDQPIANRRQSGESTLGEFVPDTKPLPLAEAIDGIEPEEADSKTYTFLRDFLSPREQEVAEKFMEGYPLEESESRVWYRLRSGKLGHPSVYRKLLEIGGISTDEAPEAESWKLQANCSTQPEVFLKQPKNAKSNLAEATAIRRACPVLEDCYGDVEDKRPEAGIWAGLRRAKASGSRFKLKNPGYNDDGSPRRMSEETDGEPEAGNSS